MFKNVYYEGRFFKLPEASLLGILLCSSHATAVAIVDANPYVLAKLLLINHGQCDQCSRELWVK